MYSTAAWSANGFGAATAEELEAGELELVSLALESDPSLVLPEQPLRTRATAATDTGQATCRLIQPPHS
ncbi:hypothetical protein MARA_52810 [Mycolicibacterium arabiense]|uniref:Uncharacterized protein n=1 Tax=Mycolicibacterium arabiense TaxID=1286181 RepID=A0A7I7S536_9MYCO|nr:hypothetical protein MARA_52810 [Mycolicibacterium arabiense]